MRSILKVNIQFSNANMKIESEKNLKIPRKIHLLIRNFELMHSIIK